MGARGPQRRDLAYRLWARVDRTGGPDACWMWQGAVTKDGDGWMYAGMSDGGTRMSNVRVHRAVWALSHPDAVLDHGTVVKHCPESRLCVNPAHLRAQPRKGSPR